MRTFLRFRSVLHVTVLAALCLAALASPARAAITGIADENLEQWSAPTWSAFNATGVKQVRHIVPWDTAYNPNKKWALDEAHAWVSNAEAHGLDILISFDHNYDGTVPPSQETYGKAVWAFRKEFPQIGKYTAWNEPNHSVTVNGVPANPHSVPGGASVAADYWTLLNSYCHASGLPPCTVIGGDFSDDANIGSYMAEYKARLASYGVSPSIWAAHPYSTMASGEWARFSEGFMPKTENKPVWVTEAGGMVCKTNPVGLVGGSYPAAEANQAASVQRLHDLVNYYGSRIQRTYYYFLSAGGGGQVGCPNGKGEYEFDSALLGAGETPRPAFNVAFPGALNPPSVQTTAASGLTPTQATLNGVVDPRGFHTVYRFDYGPTASYGSVTPNADGGFNAGGVGVSAAIGGLLPGTTYHYRVVASNPGGNTYGPDQTFRTAPRAPMFAFQANTGVLWTYSTETAAGSTGLGMAPGTSPSIAGISGQGYIEAFQADTGILWTRADTGPWGSTGYGMLAGTSPSVASTPGGGYAAAFQTNLGTLAVRRPTTGWEHVGTPMAPATSPAIAGLAGSPPGFVDAVQDSGNLLRTYTTSGGWWNGGFGMLPGTSPGVAELAGGNWAEAFQANTGVLLVYSSASGWFYPGTGMAKGTSPTITGLAGGGYALAFQANDNTLWIYSTASGWWATGAGMRPGTSPAIAALPGGGYTLAFQANTSELWTYASSAGWTNTGLGMAPGTSPAVAAEM